jgi:hypothetical protein
MLRCVGNRWHRREDDPSAWADDGDEQPLDAASCTEAMVEAWRYTDDPRYARLAGWAYSWFLGRNKVGVRLYSERTGGCHDGLSVTAANPNQGAESTLAYYQALLSLVGGGLAKLPARTANAPQRPVVPDRTSARPSRPTTPGRTTAPPTSTTTTPTTPTTTAGTTAVRGEAPGGGPPATGATQARLGNREGPTDAR